jgi:hypothetical protein
MNLKKRLIVWAGAALLLTPMVKAQDADTSASALKGKVEDHDARIVTLENDLAGLKKIKISGYIQGRYEVHADSKDTATLAGAAQNKDYFYVKRGRVKTVYDAGSSIYTMEVDASNGVSLKEASAQVNFAIGHQYPINLKAGQFKWPSSYENLRSSADREMPEASLAIRTLLPGEYDRGIQLGIAPFSYAALNVGLFNGYGISNSTYPIITPTRNPAVVGRLTGDLGIFTLGVSGFFGTSASLGKPDSTNKITPYTLYDKNRLGGDGQFFYQLPIFGGGRLMAEAIQGKDWSSSKKDSTNPSGQYVNSLGWYGELVQNIFGHDQIALRYDFWDPDTDPAKTQDGITTLGIALIHHFDGNIKLTLAYDMHTYQDTTKSKVNDNFLTAQLQIRF